MRLEERIQDDVKAAQKASASGRLGTLRLLVAALKNRSIEKRTSGSAEQLTDEDVIEVLQREAKKRREAIDIYRKTKREDLAHKEEAELAVINEYLPSMLGRAEIEAVLDELVASGVHDFAPLMKAAMERLKGRADGKLVSELVRAKAQ